MRANWLEQTQVISKKQVRLKVKLITQQYLQQFAYNGST